MKFRWHFLMAPEGGEGGGGAGGGAGAGKEGEGKPDSAKEIEALKAENATMKKQFEELRAKLEGKAPEGEGDDLRKKALKQAELDKKKTNDAKAIEAALRFSMNSAEWIKQNQSLLPKEISDIFKAAEKENYDSAVEKDAAIKSGVIQSFFAIQSNLDLLTPAVKIQLEDYLKLTKDGKQQKAQEIYDLIFEPAFEMLRRVKRAENLNKGYGPGTGVEESYKTRMIERSKQHYLGEKPNA